MLSPPRNILRIARFSCVVGALALAGCDDDAPTAPADAGADVPATPTDVATDIQSPNDTGGGDAAPDAPQTAALRSTLVAACGAACARPQDAIPSRDGSTIFFTAFAPTGEAAVFRVPVQGGAITMLAMGGGMEFPVGIAISDDDGTLYIADQTAERATDAGPTGAIFSLPAAGGTPAVVNVGADLIRPAAIALSADGMNLLVTGQRASMEGMRTPALFQVPRTGGTATVVTTDLVDPSGVSQAASGAIICHDTRRGGAGSATAVTVMPGGMAMERAGGLVAGYPAGLAYSMSGTGILFSGALPETGPGLLTFAAPSGGATSPAETSMGMVRPLGLHRARAADVYAVADDSAGENGSVFVVR